MSQWYMLTLVGEDRPGIVAHITAALFEAGGNLGEASMMRLGGNFTIMLMVDYAGSSGQLEAAVVPVAESLGLQCHIVPIEGHLHQHLEPDVSISVYGADRSGIVAQVTGVLAQAGMHITDLESDVAGSDESPLYVLHIEGHAHEGIEALESALATLADEGVEVCIRPLQTLVG